MNVKNVKRYVPLVAVAYIAAITIARGFGYEGFASGLATIGGVVGLDSASPVSGAELSAAAAAFAGVCIKVYNVVRSVKG